MTDEERFRELYRSFGVELPPTEVDADGNRSIYLRSNHPRFEGYVGFYSLVEFSPLGKFITQVFYE